MITSKIFSSILQSFVSLAMLRLFFNPTTFTLDTRRDFGNGKLGKRGFKRIFNERLYGKFLL